MVSALSTLLLFQLAGEVAVHTLALPLPGPVAGMALLFSSFLLRKSVAPSLVENAERLLSHLALFFVPAGTGVVLYLGVLRSEWLPIAVTLVASTALTIVVTAHTLRALTRRATRRRRLGIRPDGPTPGHA